MPLDPDYCTEQVADKVAYEFHMFEFLGKEIERTCPKLDGYIPGESVFAGTGISWHEDDMAWAMLESFLLHARGLYEFFTAMSRYKDNILPSDYSDKWIPRKTDSFTYLEEVRIKRLHKALAHIAKERIQFTDGWDVEAIRREIGSLIEDFKKELPEERRDWFTYNR